MNIFNILRKYQYSSQTAIIYKNIRISYKELVIYSINLSELIMNNFGKRKQTIGIFLPNSSDYTIAFFAAAYSDKVIVPFNVNMKKLELQRIIKYLNINVIITNKLFYDRLSDITEKKISIICLKNNYEAEIYNRCNADANQLSDDNEELKDVAMILHTSGSMNFPKSVMLTHENIISCIKSIVMDLKITEKDVTLIFLPMYYISAIVSQFLTHLYVGAAVSFMETLFSPVNLFYCLEKFNITNFSCVPYMLLELLNQKDKIKNYKISSLRYVCFGGAPAPGEKINELANIFPDIQFIKTYGLTEASTRVSHYFEDKNIINNNCVGKQIPGVKYMIVDENGNECKAGEIGEIAVKGNNIMKGYYLRHTETEKALKNGWLHTGDLGRIDDKHNLYVVGRKKNIIIRGGENIYPEEIEDVLNNYPNIKESLVYGAYHETLGEVPQAEIVLNSYNNFNLQELVNYCYNNLSNFKIPLHFKVVDEIDKTSNGKLIRNLKRRINVEDNFNLENELKKLINENTYVLLTDKDFKEDSDLIVDFGYDSLSIIRLIADIERKFNIEFEISELVSEIISKYGNLKKSIAEKISAEV
jgi:long-chain acyl-CoA synthetase